MNDDTAPSADADSASIVEKVRNASASVFERFGVCGKTADGAPGLDTPQNASGPALHGQPGVDPANALVDAEMVKRSACAVLRCVDGGVQRKLYGAAWRLSSDKEFASGFVAETALTEPEILQIGDLTAIVFAKHAITAKYAPELALSLSLANYGGRVWFALRKLEQLAREKKESEKKGQNAGTN